MLFQLLPSKVQQLITAWQFSTLEVYVLGFTIVFLLLTLVLISIILIRRTYLPIQEQKKQVLIGKLETHLVDYLHSSTEEREKIVTTLTQLAKPQSAFDRQVLCDQIVLIYTNVGGDEAAAIQALYQKLGFYKEAVQKTKHWAWNTSRLAVLELVTMNLTQDSAIFLNLIAHKNPYVRIEALRAVISEGNSHWKNLLVQYKPPLSKWEQYLLCERICKLKNFTVKDCSALLKSSNATVVELTNNVIKHVQANDRNRIAIETPLLLLQQPVKKPIKLPFIKKKSLNIT